MSLPTKAKYHLAVAWTMLAVLFAVLIVLIAGSPPHRDDVLFWFFTLNVAGLIFLAIVLHNEESQKERARFIRMFFLADWLTGVVLAAYVILKNAAP